MHMSLIVAEEGDIENPADGLDEMRDRFSTLQQPVPIPLRVELQT
jgi:hypothetical protein